MAIPVSRVHLAMAHAALPGLLPTPPKCTMLALLPAPPCAVILPNNSPPRSSRSDAAGRWDAHKIKPPGTGSPVALSSSSSSGGQWTSSPNTNKNSRADSVERWDAHKKPASPASSTSFSASISKTKTCHVSRRSNSRAPPSSAERWDAHKKSRVPPATVLDDGESSTGSDDVEMDMPPQPQPPRSFYAGFITSPEPSMLPMPSFMIRVA